MNKARLEAFSDGVIAIAITIMVLGLQTPQGPTWDELRPLVPQLLSYVLSFVYVGIYWVNHHHLLQAVTRVDRGVLWANLHLLFWLSLIPLVTNWVAGLHRYTLPVVCYGAVLMMCSLSFLLLKRCLSRCEADHPALAAALGRKSKSIFSIAMYAVAIPLAIWAPLVSTAIYVVLAIVWFLPGRRLNRDALQTEQG